MRKFLLLSWYIQNKCIAFTAQDKYLYEGGSVPTVVTLDDGIKQNTQFKQFPETNPQMSHIPSITRPGSDEEWLNKEDTSIGRGTFHAKGELACGPQAQFYMETQSAVVVPNSPG